MFNVDECPKHNGCYHGSQLRNLGLALAPLLLGISTCLASDNDSNEYHQWDGGEWGVIYRSTIIEKVFIKTTSAPLCDAIRFCLNDDTAMANDRFKHGFLLKCIEHFYKPSVFEKYLPCDTLTLYQLEHRAVWSSASQNNGRCLL